MTASAKQFGIEGFPYFAFFVSGQQLEYTGGPSSEELVSWLRRKTGPSKINIENEKELARIQTDNDANVYFLGDPALFPKEYAIFDVASKMFDEVIFVQSKTQAILDIL